MTLRFEKWRDNPLNGCRKWVTCRDAARMEVAHFLRDQRRRTRIGWIAALAAKHGTTVQFVVAHWCDYCRVFGADDDTHNAPAPIQASFSEFLDLKLLFSDGVPSPTTREPRAAVHVQVSPAPAPYEPQGEPEPVAAVSEYPSLAERSRAIRGDEPVDDFGWREMRAERRRGSLPRYIGDT